MPRTTYYNLPPEKRTRIHEAILNEFSRVSFHQASINRIIQEANIPRGSFYQYFSDKQDCLDSVLLSYRDAFIERLQIILNSKENLFDSIRLVYKDINIFFNEKRSRAFCMNLIADTRQNTEYYLHLFKRQPDPTELLFLLKTRLQPYAIEEDEIYPFIDILSNIFNCSILELVNSNATISVEHFNRKLALLEKAFERK